MNNVVDMQAWIEAKTEGLKEIQKLYKVFLEELEEEIEFSTLDPKSPIQVLRGRTNTEYMPIIDWYYSHDQEMENLLEEKEMLENYLLEKPYLREATVEDVMAELNLFLEQTKI